MSTGQQARCDRRPVPRGAVHPQLSARNVMGVGDQLVQRKVAGPVHVSGLPLVASPDVDHHRCLAAPGRHDAGEPDEISDAVRLVGNAGRRRIELAR